MTRFLYHYQGEGRKGLKAIDGDILCGLVIHATPYQDTFTVSHHASGFLIVIVQCMEDAQAVRAALLALPFTWECDWRSLRAHKHAITNALDWALTFKVTQP